MVDTTGLKQMAEEGKQAFSAGQYGPAAEKFQAAADGYASLNDKLAAAEMKNNLSVTLLKQGDGQAALDAVLGTEQVFADGGDLKREAMAAGNQAAALEALKRWDEALAAYDRSAQLFSEAGEGDLRAMVLKSAAAIKLRRGKVTDSAVKMIGSLEAKDKPSLFERLLRSVVRFIQR